jgi:hypothetical protein
MGGNGEGAVDGGGAVPSAYPAQKSHWAQMAPEGHTFGSIFSLWYRLLSHRFWQSPIKAWREVSPWILSGEIDHPATASMVTAKIAVMARQGAMTACGLRCRTAGKIGDYNLV